MKTTSLTLYLLGGQLKLPSAFEDLRPQSDLLSLLVSDVNVYKNRHRNMY